MFDQTFVEVSRGTKGRRLFGLSLMIEIAVITLLALAPLIYLQELPNARFHELLAAPSLPHPPVVKIPLPIDAGIVPRQFKPLLSAPAFVPKRINPLVDQAAAPLDLQYSTEGNDSGAVPSGAVLPFSEGTIPPPAKSVKPQETTRTITVGGQVAEANLVQRVQPAYPPLAKAARIQGIVEFQAVISREGAIENLRLLHGHPLLVAAARDAILQWRYRPTSLNGQPVEVVTRILVNFSLNN